MKQIQALLASLLAVFGTLSAHSQCYELTWSEEFNTPGRPSPATWSFETGGDGWGNNELQYYRSDSANAYIYDSTLVITARKESYGGRSYTSARILTRDKFAFRYGRIEASMKLPFGQGIWPAFWIMGQDIGEAGWPACGETDIMEMVGGGSGDSQVHGTLHWDNEGEHQSYGQGYTLPEGIFADTFHLFAVEWTPTTITWYVDDVQFNIIDITPDFLSEFHQPFFIILNLAVGGDWPGSPDATTTFPQELKVDYIRVYKDAEDLQMEGDGQSAPQEAGKIYSLPELDGYDYQWTVPADGEITGGQGSSSIEVTWGCGDGMVECQLTGPCGSFNYSFPVEVQNSISGPVFAGAGEENLLFHVWPMSDTEYLWTVPEDAEIMAGQGNDSLLLRWGDLSGQVELECTNACGTSSYTHEVLIAGSYPFPDPHAAHDIPGTFNATDFNYGGEGIAYHDLTAINEGDGDRQDEGVDTQFSDYGGANVGWIQNGEWMDYSIRVDSSWWYSISFRVASPYSTGAFSILVNGEERMGPVEVPATGDWDQFRFLRKGNMELFRSDTILRIHITRGDFNLGNMQFILASTTSLDPAGSTEVFYLYPNPVKNMLVIKHSTGNFSFRIFDISGRLIMQDTAANPETAVDLGSLESGIYLLRLWDGKGRVYSKNFLKVN